MVRGPLLLWPIFLVATIVCLPKTGVSQNSMRVTIIEGSNFVDPELQDPTLKESIVQAAAGLTTFFEKNYHITPTTIKDPTANQIRSFLNGPFAEDLNTKVHLLFILTHGFNHVYPADTPFRTELFLAGSDTMKANYLGSGIAFSDFLKAFQRLPRETSVFVFLDTCHSGAVANPGFRFEQDVMRRLGPKLVILSSSAAEKESYSALFTRALLRVWNDPQKMCSIGKNKIKSTFLNEMRQIDPVLAEKQSAPELATRVYENFCVDMFSKDSAFVTLWNPTKDRARVQFTSIDPSDLAGADFEQLVEGEDLFPIRVPRKTYYVDVSPANQNPKSTLVAYRLRVPLGEQLAPFISLAKPPDQLSLGRAREEAARLLAFSGAPEQGVVEMKEAAALAYAGLPDQQNAASALYNELAASHLANRSALYAIDVVRKWSAQPSPSDVRRLSSALVVNRIDPLKFSMAVGQAGRFNMAAELCRAELMKQTVPNELKNSFANCAYYNYLATGKEKESNQILQVLGNDSPSPVSGTPNEMRGVVGTIQVQSGVF